MAWTVSGIWVKTTTTGSKGVEVGSLAGELASAAAGIADAVN